MCLYVPCRDIRYDFCIKRCLVSLYLCIVVPNTYWAVFFCLFFGLLLVSCVPHVASFSGLSIFDYPFGIL